MKIEKKTFERPHKKLIKPASFQDVDTGDRRERKIIKQDGSEVIEQVPITQRVHFEPVFEDAIQRQERWTVKTMARGQRGEMVRTPGGLVVTEFEEEHEFASEADAKRFIEDTRKGEKGIVIAAEANAYEKRTKEALRKAGK